MNYADLGLDELVRARRKFPRPFASAHEGYAVLREEVDELWSCVKHDDVQGARREAVQVLAMAIRFLEDSAGWSGDNEGRNP